MENAWRARITSWRCGGCLSSVPFEAELQEGCRCVVLLIGLLEANGQAA